MSNNNISSNNIALPQMGHADFSAKPLIWPGAFALMMLGLLAPALWNGFPLIFADTGGYLARPFEGTLELGRSALYGAFLASSIRLEFWPNVLAQAALTVWLLALTLRTHVRRLRVAEIVLVVIALTLLTSLPWITSQLLPDIFMPLSALALHLLAFRRTHLRSAEIAGLLALIAFAIASHMAILAVMLAVIAAYLVMHLAASRLRLPRPWLVLPAAALAAGIALALTSNWIIGGQFAFTPGGASFLFGRLVQDGIVGRYLDRECPDATLRLCAYRNELRPSSDDWLWWPQSPLSKLGGWREFTPEAERIIAGTLRTDPLAHLRTAIGNTLLQLVMVQTGNGVNPEDTQHAVWIMSERAPDAMRDFQAAAQQRDQFDFTWINRIDVPIALLAAAALPFLALWLRRRRPAIAALALSTLLVLLANAAICGIFSGPNDRYQSRLTPIAALVVLIVALDRRRQGVSGLQRAPDLR